MFRFSIRDVLWLTALVAMGTAWWADHQQQSAVNLQLPLIKWRFRAEALKDSVERNKGTVLWQRNLYCGEELYVESNGVRHIYEERGPATFNRR